MVVQAVALGILLKHWAIGFPEVAEAPALPVAFRNPAPEPGAGLGRTVSDHKRYDLPGPSAEGHPELPLIRSLSDIFQHSSVQHSSSSRTSFSSAGRSPSATESARCPFFEPSVQRIPTHAKNPTDCPLRPAFAVGPENFLFLLLGVAARLGVEHLMRPAIFAVILLGAAGAVAVFDDVRGAAFSALGSRLNHR